ncbi:Putative GATA transcription factor 22, partial [Glycine soja]
DSSSECGHHNVSLYKIEDEENKRDHDYEKWMSSTARLTRKMMRLPSTSSDLATKKALNNITRVCADCNTTSTPLWRSGPNGPKSLCNACGIRQRKARRAMAEAVNGFAPSVNSSSTKIRVHHKEKKSRTNHFARFRLKCKLATTSTAEGTSQQENVKIDLNDFGLSLRDSSALKQQVFPIMDEVAQAAMLLMDLSCGFVYC